MKRNAWKKFIVFCAFPALLLACASSARAEAVYTPPPQGFVEKLALFPVICLLVLLAMIVWIDPYLRPGHKRTMRLIIAAIVSLVIQNYAEYRLGLGPARPLLRTAVSVFGYAVRPVILVLFLRLIRPDQRMIWAWVLAGVNGALYVTAFFSGVCFSITPDNNYMPGPLADVCRYVSLLLLMTLCFLTVRSFSFSRWKDGWMPLLIVPLILAGIYLDNTVHAEPQPATFLTAAVVISTVFYYIWVHMQYVREHEQSLQEGQRTQLMLSQIKPHFLHNALTVIVGLCDIDPQRAKQATLKFARYLRGNMDSMEASGPIPFEKELAHTKLFLEIEQLRFGDALQVHYDIGCTRFFLPALTVEPLAENAVRHGIRENPEGKGTVTISSRETEEYYEISVIDDGQGFDPSVMPADGQKHIGIANVRERLAQVCGGTVEFDSAPGRGTTARILIPKETEGH